MMEEKNAFWKSKRTSFYKSLLSIALPVTLQSLLQSSFSVIDQMMIGQLGSANIAGIGLGGKFASLYAVVLGAIAAAAGIMIAQYMGQENQEDLRKSFHSNLLYSILLAAVFMAVCMLFPQKIMSLYTKDGETCVLAAEYLRIYSLSFLPMAVLSIAAVMLRCMDAAVYPLIAGVLSVVLNTALNYLFIFGKCGIPAMGVSGAAAASVLSQAVSCVLTVFFLVRKLKKRNMMLYFDCSFGSEKRKLYYNILAPILICEFLWSLGENVYGAIYGNMGTKACAAMTMTGSVQGLMIGALSGLSQAAGIMVGKSLGKEDYDKARSDSRKLLVFGLAGSFVLSLLLLCLESYYVGIYNVEPEVRKMACQILTVFAIISPVKVQNMILGGGILRSGGKTKYVMWVDIIGTWLFGVPLGLLGAFVWKLSIPYVYFILSLEEVVRLGISVVIFKTGHWMERI